MARPTGGRASRSEGGVQWFRALILIIILVVVGVFILGRTGSSPAAKSATTRPTTAPTSAPTTPATTTPTTTPPLAPSQVKVQVLNGLRTGTLASQWTTKLKTFGYQTGPPDDATSTVTTSVIYVITPGYKAEAEQLAAHVGLPASAVSNQVPAPASVPITAAERAATNLVLIVGNDLAGQA